MDTIGQRSHRAVDLGAAFAVALALALAGCGETAPPGVDASPDVVGSEDVVLAMDVPVAVDIPAAPDAPDGEAGGCAVDEVRCEGVCTAVATDPLNCGACGVACPASQACVGGACACTPGRALCGATCRDLQYDPTTCGACTTACGGATPYCVAGVCAATCPSGRTACGGRCVDTTSDANNCGRCGGACPSGEGCLAGACVPCSTPGVDCGTRSATVCGSTVCAGMNAVFDTRCSGTSCVIRSCYAGWGNCDGRADNGCEANLNTSTANCGACGSACAAGQTCCLGRCRDLQTDTGNCGLCNHACGYAQTCASGACACVPGYGNCDGDASNGCETSLRTLSDCGACGRSCFEGQTCPAGACTGAGSRCAAGRANCDGNAANGCEVDLDSSPTNCGACGTRCPTGQGCCAGVCRSLQTITDCGACGRPCALGQTCDAGACTGSAANGCPDEFANCDGNAANGCEANLRNDPSHCLSCNPCLPGQSCLDGQCNGGYSISCPAGYGNCDDNPRNGCESDLRTDPYDCGACNGHCPLGMPCLNGACQCPTGQAWCVVSGFPAGVCVQLNTAANCGACNRQCLVGQTCEAGVCTGAGTTCAAGYGNCDGNAANGCETNVYTSSSHCGACGLACPAGQGCCHGNCTDYLTSTNHCGGCDRPCNNGTCEGGLCTCATGFGDCDDNHANGCETGLGNSSNCGRCGNECSGGGNQVVSCSALQCTNPCLAGYADCDNAPANGCEVDTRTNTANCGGCNRRCFVGQTCVLGVCTGASTACAANRGNCDGDPTNGCEVDIQSSVANCGACGNACAAGQACCLGRCRSVQTDGANCGVCDRPCIAGQSCSAGVCVGTGTACPAGYANCDGNAANGCEVRTQSSEDHCGACDRPCRLMDACVNSACTGFGGACPAGYGDCDGNTANGCESRSSSACSCGQTLCVYGSGGFCRSLLTDSSNCGACFRPCLVGQVCDNGVCTGSGSACPVSWRANCDGNLANGCEVNLSTSTTHCGGCGRPCLLGQGCVGGECVGVGTTCPAGYGNCDLDLRNGCEADTRTNASHCGVCGHACAAGQVCSRGVCAP